MKDKGEIAELKKTKIYKFMDFMNKMGRAIQTQDEKPINLEIFNSQFEDKEKLDRETFYKYLRHY